jgi:hypothetical protein
MKKVSAVILKLKGNIALEEVLHLGAVMVQDSETPNCTLVFVKVIRVTSKDAQKKIVKRISEIFSKYKIINSDYAIDLLEEEIVPTAEAIKDMGTISTN